MANNKLKPTTDRRQFLGSLAGGAAAMGLAAITPSLSVHAEENYSPYGTTDDPDKWFDQIKGKHRIVYDATQPHEIMPFAWPRVFLLTNEGTGTPAKECGVVVVLRHSAIGYAFEDRLWAKYNFGEVFKADDPATKKPSVRNPFWKPKPGDFKVPGIGEVKIGINELQESGVMFCVCSVAISVYSAVVAEGMKMNAEEVKNDWMTGLLPGIQLVPSGVWALGRAQERKCAYCFAG